MEQNLIGWNIENWITVTLMVALGYLFIVVLSHIFKISGITGSIGSGPIGNVVQFPQSVNAAG